MSTLLDLRSRIKRNLAIDGTLYDQDIDDSIRSALSMYEQRPMWFLETLANVTLTTGNDSTALPDNFGSPKDARILVNNTYRSRADGEFVFHNFDELQSMYRTQLQSNIPRNYSFFAQRIYTDALANDDYEIELTYYKKDATQPTDDTDTSVWFGEGIDLIRATAMAIFKDEAQEYDSARDWQRAALYEKKLNGRNTLFKVGGAYAKSHH